MIVEIVDSGWDETVEIGPQAACCKFVWTSGI
jgi:hypothetical protein